MAQALQLVINGSVAHELKTRLGVDGESGLVMQMSELRLALIEPVLFFFEIIVDSIINHRRFKIEIQCKFSKKF